MTTDLIVKCKECEYEWTPRYQPEQYRLHGGDRRLKCPECNQGQKGRFEFVTVPGGFSPDWRDSAALKEAWLGTETEQLRHTLDNAFLSIVGASIRNVTRAVFVDEEVRQENPVFVDEEVRELASQLYDLYEHLDDVTSPDN